MMTAKFWDRWERRKQFIELNMTTFYYYIRILKGNE